jgi:starvation-inducible DNA-binding protein
MDIGINKKDREKIADGLSHLLADSFTLYLKTHNFHWNVTGPMFNTLHVMFMDQYTELWNALDDDRRTHPRPRRTGPRHLRASSPS